MKKHLLSEANQDQCQQYQAKRNQGGAEEPGIPGHALGRRVHQVLFELAVGHKAVVLGFAFMLEFLQRHGSGEHDDILRQFARTPVAVEVMDREEEHGGQEGLFSMHDGGYVKDPARQERGSGLGEREHQAGDSDDEHAPERRPVVELFEIGPVVEDGTRSLAQEPAHHVPEIPEILPARQQGVGAKPSEGLSMNDEGAV